MENNRFLVYIFRSREVIPDKKRRLFVKVLTKTGFPRKSPEKSSEKMDAPLAILSQK